MSSASGGPASSGPAPRRQVRLRLVHIDFWSALKLSFLASIGVAIVNLVVIMVIYSALSSLGVISQLSTFLSGLLKSGSNLASILSFGQVLGFAVVVAVIDILVVTVFGALLALLYNLAAKITRGLLVGFTNQ